MKMLKRTVLSAFCAAAILVPGVAYAQSSATLTLRSGEKVNGDLIDLGGVGYTVRVSGNERQIPQNDVAVIDFTGGNMTDADWAKFTGGSQIVLRNGQTIDGSLYDISGTSPQRFTVKTNNGDREISSNEVARIVIARPQNAVATSGSGTPSTPSVAGAITVQANQAWTSTGITVRRGQTLTLTTTGDVQLSEDVNDLADANGHKGGRKPTANGTMNQVLAGALIGRIGNGAPFGIGKATTITAPASGVLFLGVNDDQHADNKGNFQVIVR
jgi:hypothetical protein